MKQLRLHHVDFLAFTARYARKDAQVHAGMRLVQPLFVDVLLAVVFVVFLSSVIVV